MPLLRHHTSSTGAGAGRPLGPLSPPVGGHLQLLLQTVGGDNILLKNTQARTHTRTDLYTQKTQTGTWILFFSESDERMIIRHAVTSKHGALVKGGQPVFVLRYASGIPTVQEQQQFRLTAAS